MARKPPERYNPGELDKTRGNLGELSKEEVRRMAELLGGEVGSEKTDEELRQKYEELRDKSPRIAPGRGHEKTISGEPPTAGSSSAYSGHYSLKKKSPPKAGYLDRIKIARIASRPEHRIKTRAAVVSEYLSFIRKKKDTVNPDFIINGDRYYYKHIEVLTNSLKMMTKMANPSFYQDYMNPYYRDIIKVITEWNVMALAQVLEKLQISPRNREITHCADLCSHIYRPIIILKSIPLNHIISAVERLYEILLIQNAGKPDDLIKVENSYLPLKKETNIVFKDVAYTCYPLLLKLTSSRFYYYNDLLKQTKKSILEFLDIRKLDLLQPPENLDKMLKKQFSLKHLEKTIKEKSKEQNGLPELEGAKIDIEEIQSCAAFIEQLFPESGWSGYSDFPDFYPYFQPVFNFPKGTELIPPEDPLQQVIVLAAVIQDLLYGFRNVAVISEHRDPIDEISGKWHFFIDSMIKKTYNSMLIEFCRNLDRGIDYEAGRYGQKLQADMFWFKRRFILPHLKFNTPYKSQSITVKTMKFHKVVNDLFIRLKDLLDDLDSRGRPVIENYDKPFHFEITNITSSRFKHILDADRIAHTNENLVRYTLMAVSFLDYLVNSPESTAYSNYADEYPLYRFDPVYHGKPLYSVGLLDTEQILKRFYK